MLVGITGALGSGKDTAGAYLVANYGFTRIGFADKLKESAAALFGVDPEDWNEWKNCPEAKIDLSFPYTYGEGGIKGTAHKEVTVRQFLQRYGTEAHREIFGDNFWVDVALKEYDESIGVFSRVVITDVRFENEAMAILKRGGYVLKINRSGTGGDSHASEQPIDDFLISGVLNNNGTYEDLYAQIDRFMYSLGPLRTPDGTGQSGGTTNQANVPEVSTQAASWSRFSF